MRYVECRIGRINQRNFPAIMPEKTYQTILHGLGVDPDATFENQEGFESQGWDYDVYWTVEAQNLDEAIKKIAAAKQDAEEASQSLQEIHHQHWAEQKGPIRF